MAAAKEKPKKASSNNYAPRRRKKKTRQGHSKFTKRKGTNKKYRGQG